MKAKQLPFLTEVENPFVGERLLKDFSKKKIIIGIDEVGRGPLAGPVVACAAVLKENASFALLNDSKKLSRKKRNEIFEQVKELCESYAVAFASVEEIDTLNILEADFLAMRRALSALGVLEVENYEPYILEKKTTPLTEDFTIAVDGNLFISGIEHSLQTPVIKGDAKIASISAASVLAKVIRDNLMDTLSEKYPEYDFKNNAGYGTKKHLEAIKKYGMTPVHRKSFHPKSLG